MRRRIFEGVEEVEMKDLGVRKTTLRSELVSLPNDLTELLTLMNDARLKHNSNQYKLVLIWIKLSHYDRYWTSFGYGSEVTFLAAFGLSDGHTLALWRNLVELFDETTFCVVGPEALATLQRRVGEKVEDANERKRH